MSLIATNRAAYPHPIRLVDAPAYKDPYCVAGAICKALGRPVTNGFPAPVTLAIAFLKTNPHLTEKHANHYAQTVVTRNDKGLFEDAWYYANRALTYTPKED
jgi:hypothetical protein